MRSRISGFLRGWEGMRRSIDGGVSRISDIAAPHSVVYIALLTPTSLAMLTGYRTRIAGIGAAALEVSLLVLGEGNALVHSLLAALGVVLALMGLGWRRIHIPKAAGVTGLRSARRTERRQSRILCLGLPIDWNIGIGTFPEGQEILVPHSSRGIVTAQSECPGELKVR